MTDSLIPDLIVRLVAMHGGNAQRAADMVGTSAANLSRWRSGNNKPRKQQEERLRAAVHGAQDRASPVEKHPQDLRLDRLEETISGTIHALREEFHRTASLSTRQEVLDLVAALFFAHVTSIDAGSLGMGKHLRVKDDSAVDALNRFMAEALATRLPARNGDGEQGGRLSIERFFTPFARSDERFADKLLEIFERDARAFRELHEAGRDDLINEVFSRFMSTSFIDEKEMGQYLTPPEITRFMVEVGFQALSPTARARLLDPTGSGGVILDPSCGVGSFLAETIRYCHGLVRKQHDTAEASQWLSHFLEGQVVGIDKSDRMLRLGMINLGLFGAASVNLELANALARKGGEGELCAGLNGRVELILTNPPFGATYSGDDLNGFAMGRGRARAESEVLFLERYVDWLVPGGVIATVVPDSILVNRNAFADLRSWLRDRCSVEAVFSLPTVTFGAAGTNTKTSVLVLRKHETNGERGHTYFGEAHAVGFDVVTRNGQRRRMRSAANDLPTLLASYKSDARCKLGRRQFLAPEAERWDAAFHIGLPENVANALGRPEALLVKVSDIATLVDQRIDPRRKGDSEFDYVEISDVDIRTGLVGHKRVASADAASRARKIIRAGDVLVSTVRPERGAVGVTPPRLDGAICSTGFAVLRCSSIHPLALVWLFKTNLVRRQMIRNNIGIAYPAISEESCLELILPVTLDGIAELSARAQTLAAKQAEFEAAQGALVEYVRDLDAAAIGPQSELGEVPHLIESAEPASVANVA